MDKPHLENNSQDMSDVQKLNAYLELSKLMYTQYHDRRSLEWRIHVLIWTFLALTAYLGKTENAHFGCSTFVIFLIIPIHLIWIIKIVKGEILEQTRSILYRSEADKILGFSQPSEIPESQKFLEEYSRMPPWMIRGFDSICWWLGIETFITAFMCFCVWLLVH